MNAENAGPPNRVRVVPSSVREPRDARPDCGELTELGHVLGLVGTSGNTGEPHLHVHAQRPVRHRAPEWRANGIRLGD